MMPTAFTVARSRASAYGVDFDRLISSGFSFRTRGSILMICMGCSLPELRTGEPLLLRPQFFLKTLPEPQSERAGATAPERPSGLGEQGAAMRER